MSDPELLARVKALAGGQRHSTFCMLVRLALEHRLSRIVETGCYRGIDADGNSTIILSMLAARLGGSLDSVDIDAQHIASAKEHTPIKEGPTLAFQLSDSIAYLESREKPIDVLYLDSFDYRTDDPKPSQEHQLKELMAAERLLSPTCLVLLDDADLKDQGKTKLSSARLIDNGWKVRMRNYQLLFSRGL